MHLRAWRSPYLGVREQPRVCQPQQLGRHLPEQSTQDLGHGYEATLRGVAGEEQQAAPRAEQVSANSIIPADWNRVSRCEEELFDLQREKQELEKTLITKEKEIHSLQSDL